MDTVGIKEGDEVVLGEFNPAPQVIKVSVSTLITEAARINLKNPIDFQGRLAAETIRLQAEQKAAPIGDHEEELDLLN